MTIKRMITDNDGLWTLVGFPNVTFKLGAVVIEPLFQVFVALLEWMRVL